MHVSLKRFLVAAFVTLITYFIFIHAAVNICSVITLIIYIIQNR